MRLSGSFLALRIGFLMSTVIFCPNVSFCSGPPKDNPPFLELTPSDRQAFLHFRLTPDKFNRLQRFAAEASNLYTHDPKFRAEWRRYADSEAVTAVVAGNISLLQKRYHRINTLLMNAGLQPSDAPLGIFSVMIGVWLATEHSQEKIKQSRSYFPKENYNFVVNHLSQAQAFLQRLPKALE